MAFIQLDMMHFICVDLGCWLSIKAVPLLQALSIVKMMQMPIILHHHAKFHVNLNAQKAETAVISSEKSFFVQI